MPGGPWLRLFWGCLHSTAPAVPKGEPAPARQGRGARAEPREMPINSLRISVSPLCLCAPPEKGPVCPAAPLGLWQPYGTGEGPGQRVQRCWVEPRRVQGTVVAVSCVFPSQWGLELLGNGVVGQETPLHRCSGHCQQQPWHWGCLLGWFTAALSCSALQAWQENPGDAFRFHHPPPPAAKAGAGGGEGSAADGAGKAPAPCQGLPGLWGLHSPCHSPWESLEATSRGPHPGMGKGLPRACCAGTAFGDPVLQLPLGLGELGCSGGLAAEPQSLSVPTLAHSVPRAEGIAGGSLL